MMARPLSTQGACCCATYRHRTQTLIPQVGVSAHKDSAVANRNNMNSELPWNWYELSYNHSIAWQIVQANLDKAWDWEALSVNRGITWELVQANLDKPWNWAYLSRNQSIKKVWLGARAQEQARLLYTKVCTGLFQEVACGISTGRQHHHSSVGKRNRPQRE